MKIFRGILFVCLAGIALGQAPKKVYLGAKLDAAATAEARNLPTADPQAEVTVYTTSDSFDKIYDSLKKSGDETKVLGSGTRKLPGGQELKTAFFIMDKAPNLGASKNWVKIQRPYIGAYGVARAGFSPKDIRDVTAIVVTKKK